MILYSNEAASQSSGSNQNGAQIMKKQTFSLTQTIF